VIKEFGRLYFFSCNKISGFSSSVIILSALVIKQEERLNKRKESLLKRKNNKITQLTLLKKTLSINLWQL